MSLFQAVLAIGVAAYAVVLVAAFLLERRRVRAFERAERQRINAAKQRLLADARKRRDDWAASRQQQRGA